MEHIEMKQFDSLKELYGNPDVYLSSTETFTLVAIPEWNWSFLWDVDMDDIIAKKKCITAISDPVFPDDAKAFVEELYHYLMGYKR